MEETLDLQRKNTKELIFKKVFYEFIKILI